VFTGRSVHCGTAIIGTPDINASVELQFHLQSVRTRNKPTDGQGRMPASPAAGASGGVVEGITGGEVAR
jgi:hypothetical protein